MHQKCLLQSNGFCKCVPSDQEKIYRDPGAGSGCPWWKICLGALMPVVLMKAALWATGGGNRLGEQPDGRKSNHLFWSFNPELPSSTWNREGFPLENELDRKVKISDYSQYWAKQKMYSSSRSIPTSLWEVVLHHWMNWSKRNWERHFGIEIMGISAWLTHRKHYCWPVLHATVLLYRERAGKISPIKNMRFQWKPGDHAQ